MVSLERGWRDFRRAPLFGLFFGGVYAVVGLVLTALGASGWIWTLMLSLGFPLVAPFAAVGLYEVSRRLEDGEPLDWGAVLGVVLRERQRQIPWAGAIIVIYFLFWSFLAHMLFALFMGPSALTNASTSWEMYLTPTGLTMVAVEIAVGGVAAFVLFSLTVVSLPLLLEREVDFITAMLLSLRATFANLGVMLVWAAVIAGLLFLGMLPWFLGLFVVLPVLGHATWHLYRRALYDPV
ncbi:DUF2189 domain-containing protein [Psychromarinibacter sp. C21-152]|uniref:DUF2189 domain-containing protein n=1 Tax=Psychromarinibacter sediminicola TaxID=3033385 RepID=A0AAE3NPF4_9RHOB|nr:DUF2189 domain-containing protein [Psychromarinibacter sediminicola]MDF0600049.1 DUF2189 domain-containing protein [Psychromarinibacter sediminicola]